MRQISACVINYRGRASLPRTLQALFTGDKAPDELLLVDSASDDGSVRMVERKFPSVRVVRLPENRGPAAARNRGFRAARHDLVFFVDHDVVVDRCCAARLRTALASHPEAVLALPRILWEDRPNTVQFEGADAHYLGLMVLRNAETDAEEGDGCVVDASSMAGGCFLIDRTRWGEELPFDDSFGFNYEDHDFGLRCRLLGHRIVCVTDARCFHGSGTAGLSMRTGEAYPPTRAYHLIRGRWVILIKSYQMRTLFLCLPMLLVYESFQLAFAIRRGWLRQWLRALSWIVSHRDRLSARRKDVQGRRVLPDREVLHGGRIPLRPDLPGGWLERTGVRILQWIADAYWRVVRLAL